MENLNTVTLNPTTDIVANLATQLSGLGEGATQLQIEAIVKDQSITAICAVDHVGQKISGSAERAVAALINFKLADAMAAADGRHWSEVIHREVSELAKALAPIKAEFFAANKGHSNTSTKWLRIRPMGYELTFPKITAPIGEGAEGAEGGEGGDSTTSRTRDEYARCVIESGKLYRMLTAPDNDAKIKGHVQGDKLVAFLEHLTAGLKALDAPLEDEDLKAFMAAVK
jgi:hypothetical protein